jgi:diguanylate cyclase (GGDEF)-like protein
MSETVGRSAGRNASPVHQTPAESRTRRLRIWILVAAIVTAVGVIGSAFTARSVADSGAAKSRAAFVQTAGEVAASLQLAVEREQDLVVTESGFFLGDPNATAAQFRAWARSVQAFERYPGLLSWGQIVLVPRAALGAFVAKFVPAASQRSFTVLPAGARPYYCLTSAADRRVVQQALPPGLDYCAGSALIDVRSSGQSSYVAADVGGQPVLAVSMPFYRGGAVPNTVARRKSAFAGWVALTLRASAVLGPALVGHRGVSVTFRYHGARSASPLAAVEAVFRAGKRPRHAQSVTTYFGNGWTVQTFGVQPASGVFANSGAEAVLLIGLALSLALGLLVLVLGTGRAHAVRVVAEQTEQLHEQADELLYQATHDSLTGLPNRVLIMDRIEQLLARAQRTGTAGAALYVDLDAFKSVNDTLGHAAGDKLLVAAGVRLKGTLRAVDTVGRMGGDEFVVLIDGGELSAGPELAAQRLLDVMRQPFELEPGGSPITVSTTIGIALTDRQSADELLSNADVALYQAKAAGRNTYRVFNGDEQASEGDRAALEFDLRSALVRAEFHLVYQPIYNLDDLTVIGAEALLRWKHPERGTVQPDAFIPILEHSGQIREVGRWVLLEACRQAVAWRNSGSDLAVSVNVSAVQLDGDAIVGDVRNALKSTGFDAGALIVEVTETALMRNPTATAKRLRAIKKLGVRIAVDDFGTGYSSLAYLQKFPVDCLKIDRAFIDTLTATSGSRALIRTIVQLGHALGLTTLAEGVETTDQLDQLRGEHVNQVQGFLLSTPLDAETFETRVLAPMRARPSAMPKKKPPPRNRAPVRPAK